MNTPEDYAGALMRWKKIQGFETDAAGPSSSAPVSLSSSDSNLCLNCTVELFGVARLLTRRREVPLSLPANATLADLFMALAEDQPALVGRVIASEKRSLTSGYACNLNGMEFVRNGSVKVNPGDRIFIISADAGG
jgi:hypothetical protein